MGMGIMCGNFTTPVSDWVRGGLCCSKSNAEQPMVWATVQTGTIGQRASHTLDIRHPFPSPPPQSSNGPTLSQMPGQWGKWPQGSPARRHCTAAMAVDTVQRSPQGWGRNDGDKIASGEPRGSSPLLAMKQHGLFRRDSNVRGSSPTFSPKMLCRHIVQSALTPNHCNCGVVRLCIALWHGVLPVAGEVGVNVHPPPRRMASGVYEG